MHTCSELTSYLEGRLAKNDAQAFEAHAESCEACTKAILRQRAIERAAQVLQRNASRTRSTAPVAERSFESYAPPSVPADAAAATEPAVRSRRMGPIVAAGAVVVVGAVLAVMWPRSEPERSEAPPPPPVARREVTPPAPPVVTPPPPVPTPTVAAVVPEKKPPPPAPAAPEALPLDTDIEALADIVASGRCAAAIAPLRARVAKDATDARSWSLLGQCYSKRKRWKNAVDAYDKAMEHDPSLVESLTPKVEAARAALEAAAAVEAPAPEPAPQ